MSGMLDNAAAVNRRESKTTHYRLLQQCIKAGQL